MRILIAEDDQVLADALLRALRAAGDAVDQVGSGNEADAALATHEFDLVILDLGLPKMHGFDVLRKLRDRGSSMPVLILTAADSVEQRVKGLDLGADDYMAKPFSLQELEARVRALIRRGQTVVGRMVANLRPLPPGNGGWVNRLMQAPLSGGIRYNGPSAVLFSFAALPNQQLSGPIAVAADFMRSA